MRIAFVLLALVALGGCVSQTTIDGKQQPDSSFDAKQAAKTRLALGLQYLQSGNFEQAKANLERAREFTPNDAAIHNGLAYYYQQVKDFTQAEQFYRSALKLEPRNGDTMNNLAVLLCTQNRYSDADSLFRQAAAAPGYVKVASTYQNAAICAEQRGDFAAADGYYQQAINYGAGAGMLEAYADSLLRQSRYSDARTVLERRARMPQFTAQYLWLEVQLARALNDRTREAQYGALLMNRFGQSGQADDYRKLKQTN
jgi:type IV pilus assembly protein PilF